MTNAAPIVSTTSITFTEDAGFQSAAIQAYDGSALSAIDNSVLYAFDPSTERYIDATTVGKAGVAWLVLNPTSGVVSGVPFNEHVQQGANFWDLQVQVTDSHLVSTTSRSNCM